MPFFTLKISKVAEVRWGEDQCGRKVVNKHLVLGWLVYFFALLLNVKEAGRNNVEQTMGRVLTF